MPKDEKKSLLIPKSPSSSDTLSSKNFIPWMYGTIHRYQHFFWFFKPHFACGFVFWFSHKRKTFCGWNSKKINRNRKFFNFNPHLILRALSCGFLVDMINRKLRLIGIDNRNWQRVSKNLLWKWSALNKWTD